ncbi:response regulator receiver protein [Aliikangiella coralliicola]|uniref:Response regulator receiver protein n=1 Tax=Aliikangiella coralliicola TaxID=2592383 RepID=A0A545UD27_9GAMM|nr:response regulator receiver protein [Aliikangiella coralliicola]TQV87365.1 response regulator receiver protein [Aliikangiella coralliicola]
MEIYAIREDGFKYQELDLLVTDILDIFPPKYTPADAVHFSYNNIALSEFWVLKKTGWSKIEGRENLIPDITKWLNATLLLSPKAHRYLSDLMSPYGEFLPIQIEDEENPHYIFNCLTTVDVDESKSSIQESRIVFLEESIGDKLFFKAPFQSCQDVYCTGRAKEQIESLGFSGIVFDDRLFSPFE